ncbi:MAG TPA: class I SAM-dependent methyltransferase [Actinomycetota bacterium]|nr:class I SAM-dependent methyltransferase [Actinomycetota bacterium]
MTPTSERLFAAWRRDLSGWGVPEEILAAAPEPPWTFPNRVFAERAERQAVQRAEPSYRRAEEALPPGGSVLDVGSGAGAASLPLATKASLITAVDPDPGMLRALADLAARTPAGARVETVAGRWPDVAAGVPTADVVVCHHVLYNVMDLRPFVEALTAHARARVVVEMTDHHPLEPMSPLWLRFHGLARPSGPSAAEAAEAVSSLGVEVGVERWGAPPLHTYESFEEMVAYHRRRLCLPADADPDIGAALQEMGVDPDHPVGLGAGRSLVTLWWAPPARGGTGR